MNAMPILNYDSKHVSHLLFRKWIYLNYVFNTNESEMFGCVRGTDCL